MLFPTGGMYRLAWWSFFRKGIVWRKFKYSQYSIRRVKTNILYALLKPSETNLGWNARGNGQEKWEMKSLTCPKVTCVLLGLLTWFQRASISAFLLRSCLSFNQKGDLTYETYALDTHECYVCNNACSICIANRTLRVTANCMALQKNVRVCINESIQKVFFHAVSV